MKKVKSNAFRGSPSLADLKHANFSVEEVESDDGIC